MSMPFSQPSSGAWLSPKDIPGHLLLITKVHDTFMQFDDLAGREKLHARFDYVDLDDPQQAEQFDVLNGHPGIANKLGEAKRTGGMVLGRITQAPSTKGQPAWVLGPYTEGQDGQRATVWLSEHPRGQVNQPAAVPAPVPQPQQAAPAAAPAPATPPAPQPAAPAPAAPAAPAGQVTVTPEMAALLQQIQAAQDG